MRKALIASILAAPLLVGLAASPATAAPGKSPAQTCKTMQVPGGPNGELGPLVGEGGYFFKQGGCASTVAHGGLDDPSQLSALTTRAGYVHTCQLIRRDEGFPFDFGYTFIPFDQEVFSIGQCADVLKRIHNFPMGPPPA